MALPIIQHRVVPAYPWGFQGRPGAVWVYRVRDALVVAEAPPEGAVEAWMVEVSAHPSSVELRWPGLVVAVHFDWAVTDPVAFVAAGVPDVPAACRGFLESLGDDPGRLLSMLDGRSFQISAGLRLSRVTPVVMPPATVGSVPATGLPGPHHPEPVSPAQQTGPVSGSPVDGTGSPVDRPVPGPGPGSSMDGAGPGSPVDRPVPGAPVDGAPGAPPRPGLPDWIEMELERRISPDEEDEPWWRRLARRASRPRPRETAAPPDESLFDEEDEDDEDDGPLLAKSGSPPILWRGEEPDYEPRGEPDDEPRGEPGEWADRSGVDGPGGETGAPARQLVAQMPAGVPAGEELGLQVRIVGAGYGGPVSAAAPLLRGLPARPGGTDVTVVVHAESGLVADGPLLRTVRVPERGDSEPVLFVFRAVARGLHRVDVKAYAGGSFLAELRAEVSVDDRARRIDGPAQRASLGPLTAVPGEVTLQVQADASGHHVFQILSDRTQFSPVTVSSLTGPPGPAVEQVLGALSRVARGADYSGRNAREWLRQSGVNLWNQLVPAAVKEQFWQVRGQMSAFTVATGHDVVPWELLYPLRPGDDDGFLVEQVPVVRRVFDQARSAHIGLGSPRYVVPPDSPADAQAEVAAVAARLGGVAGPVIDRLDEVLDLVESGEFGMAHFACHNNYRADAGSSIRLRDGSFVPVMLSAATVGRSLARNRPLVFINACRSAGEVPQYTQMMGWAKQFMAAGAGAFVGTLWDIRSRSAAAFADGFYQRLADGRTLGEAAHETRLAAARDPGDPTWLAYSVYGDPAATARGETRATR